MMRRTLTLAIALLLTACNLQQQITPTPAATLEPAFVTPTGPPTQSALPLPTLQPTPTQIVLVTATPDVNPTTVNFTNNGTVVPGQPTQDAALFDERYEVAARGESTLTIKFDVLLTRGTIFMIFQGPDGLLWEKTFTTTEVGDETIAITTGGVYEILVDWQNFDGNFAVSWE